MGAKSVKQSGTATSSAEAELVAAFTSLRILGVPMLDVWEKILNKKHVKLQLREDNEAAATVMRSGRNPNMRHIERCMGISISWIWETYRLSLIHI